MFIIEPNPWIVVFGIPLFVALCVVEFRFRKARRAEEEARAQASAQKGQRESES